MFNVHKKQSVMNEESLSRLYDDEENTVHELPRRRNQQTLATGLVSWTSGLNDKGDNGSANKRERHTKGRTHFEVKLSFGQFDLEMFERNRQKFQLCS